MVCSRGESLTHRMIQMKRLIALTCITAFAGATYAPAPAKAWGGLINAAIGTTVNAIQENERRNAETKRLEIQAQERSTEEAIQAEVERRLAQERAKSNKENTRENSSTNLSSLNDEMAAFRAEMAAAGVDACSTNFVGPDMADLFSLGGLVPGMSEKFAESMGCTKADSDAWIKRARQREEACMARGYKGYREENGKCWG